MGFFFGKKDRSPESLEAQAQEALERGDGEKAFRLFEKSLKAREPAVGDTTTLRTRIRMVDVLVELGKTVEAETLCEAAIDDWEKTHQPDTLESIGWRHTLGLVYSITGKHGNAVAAFNRCVSLLHKEGFDNESLTAVVRQSLAEALISNGNFAEAETALREAVAIEERQNRKQETGTALRILADFYARRGRFSEAGDCYERAAVLSRGLVDKKEVAALLMSLSRQRECECRYADGVSACRQALQELSATADDVREDTIEPIERLAILLMKQKRFADADTLQRKVVEWRRKQFGENHRLTLLARKCEGDVLRGKGMLIDSCLVYEDILVKAQHADNWGEGDRSSVLIALATSYNNLGFAEKAKALCEEAIAASNADPEFDEETRIEIHAGYAANLAMMHDYTGSLQIAQEVAALYAQKYGESHYWTVNARKALALWTRRNTPGETPTPEFTIDPEPPKYESHNAFLRRELSSNARPQSIRVFISSTFRDMMDEREHLMKRVFPELRRRCSARGIEFMEVDLRWGVTEEEAKQGKVIEICLSEIDKSRPYFIGILGERYGWTPAADEYQRYTRVLESFPWVKEDIDVGLSITEMEIQYGVLRNPAMLGSAFFYLRKPELTPRNEGFREEPDSVAAKKLARLKDTLATQQSFPVKSYGTYDELGTQVAEDLWRVIGEHFPSAQLPELTERQRLDHLAVVKRHLGVHVGFDGYLRKLNEFADSNKSVLVVSGAPGSGKSALLANWIVQYQKSHDDAVVLFHFAGSAPDSISLNKFLQRLIREMSNEFHLAEISPDETNYLQEALRDCFASVPRDRQFVIVVDAGDAIAGQLHAGIESRWIPDSAPPNVHFILSAGEQGAAELAHLRSCEVISLQPLAEDDRRQLIEEYLLGYGKSLKNDNIAKIIADDVSLSPLTLRALLDELRVFGLHEKLDEFIHNYLDAKDPVELFSRILQRLERDYGDMCERLLARTLSVIALSTSGVTEKELLDISGVAPMHWAFIDNALSNQLIRGNGLIRFANSYFAEAVRRRYLATEQESRQVTSAMTGYFLKDPANVRSLDELPALLRRSGDATLFEKFISDAAVIGAIWRRSSAIEFQLWMRELSARIDIAAVFTRAVERWEKEELLGPLAIASICSVLALVLRSGADATARKYLPFYKKAETLRSSVFGDDHLLTAVVKIDVANAFLEIPDLRSAVPVLSSAFKTLYPQAPNSLAFRDLLFVMAKIEMDSGKIGDADATLVQALEINERVVGKTRGAARFRSDALRKRALIASKLKRYEDAACLMEQAITAMIEASGNNSPSLPLLNVLLANYHAFGGNDSVAEKMYRSFFEQERPSSLPLAYYGSAAINYGNLLGNQKRFAEAENILMTGLRALESKDVFGARTTEEGLLSSLAELYDQQGMTVKAEEFRQRAAACTNNTQHA